MSKFYLIKPAAFLLCMICMTAVVRAQRPAAPVPAKQRAIQLLRKNLRVSGLSQTMLEGYQVSDAYEDRRSGNFIVYLQQAYLGIPVYNKIGVYIFRNDTLVEKRPDFVGKMETKAGTKTGFSVDGGQAIGFAARHLSINLAQPPRLVTKDDVRKHFVYSTGAIETGDNATSRPKKNLTSDLVWLPVKDGQEVRLSWNVRVISEDERQDWNVRIDAQTGEVLEKNSLILNELSINNASTDDCDEEAGQHMGSMPAKQVSSVQQAPLPFTPAPPPPAVTGAAYRVIPFPIESNNFGARSLETDPWLKAGAVNDATTLGWHFDNTTNYIYTRGNNVWAQQDLAGTSATTGFSDTSVTAIPSLTFDRVNDTTLSPSTYANIRAAIDNLFYWNNLMHDISYQYGFDEAAGNFQTDNLGRGGIGADYVHAFAEDGAGLSNANFATPPDGENGTMRMYQFIVTSNPVFHINAPSDIIADYTTVESVINLNNRLTTTGSKTADIVQLNDPAGTHLACGTVSNAAALAGKIALIDRGSCSFAIKIKAAQTAGAIGVIMVNSTAGAAPTAMSGNDATINIPAMMISKEDGDILKAKLASGLNGTMSATGKYSDGALDNGVISHEFTHGISNRLTGGPANAGCLVNAEQMGEGWSDYVALMVTTDWSTAAVTDGTKKRPIGTYVLNQPATGPGIRTYPYSTDMSINPWTYAMLAGSTSGEVHSIGEIWCATIWDMTWNIIQLEGIDPDIYHGTKGNNIALQLVIEGLKYQPCSPGFLDGRDAILKADSILYGYKHKCAIWNAFARRGMGVNASQGSSASYTDQIAGYLLPSGLGVSQTVSKPQLAQGDNVTYTIKAYCDCSPLSGVSIVDTLSSTLGYISSSGGSYTAPYVHFDGLNFAAGEIKTLTIQANVLGAYALPDTLIKDTRDPANYTWTSTVTTGGTLWAEVTTNAHSGTHSYHAADQGSPTDFALQSADLLLDTISTLSFWHYYETDAGYDGAVVEITTNGGSSWQDLGTYMTQNGYNSSLDPTYATALGNRRAFTGSSGGWIQTVIRLTGFAGKTARIRFRFTSDIVDGGDGWYIDDITMTNEKGAYSIASAFSGSSSLLSTTSTISSFGPGSLPVNFLSFEVKKRDNNAVLRWTVNGEINAGKYVVERSGDGINFAAIGEVAADGLGSGDKTYDYTDGHTLEGRNFYRIAETDLDGKVTLSPVRLLTFSSSGLVLRLSPVPTYNHAVQLEIETAGDEQISAVLINAMGVPLKSYSVRPGSNFLDLQDFARGIYFLKVRLSNGAAEIRKLVIQ